MRAIRQSLLLLGVLVSPAAAVAQAVPPIDRCRGLLVLLPMLTWDDPAAQVTGADPGTCRFGGVRTPIVDHFAFHADSVTVSGIASRHVGPSLPMSLRIEAHGFARLLYSGSPSVDYRFAQQQGAPAEGVFDFTYDPVAKTLAIHELSLDKPAFGRVSIDGELDGVEPVLSLQTPPPGAQDIAIRRLHVRMDSRGFVPTYILPLVAVGDAESVGEVERRVRRQMLLAAGFARGLALEAHASPVTAEAIGGVVTQFPHPEHPFEISITAADPIRLSDMPPALESIEAAAALARRLTVEATYAGAFRP